MRRRTPTGCIKVTHRPSIAVTVSAVNPQRRPESNNVTPLGFSHGSVAGLTVGLHPRLPYVTPLGFKSYRSNLDPLSPKREPN